MDRSLWNMIHAMSSSSEEGQVGQVADEPEEDARAPGERRGADTYAESPRAASAERLRGAEARTRHVGRSKSVDAIWYPGGRPPVVPLAIPSISLMINRLDLLDEHGAVNCQSGMTTLYATTHCTTVGQSLEIGVVGRICNRVMTARC